MKTKIIFISSIIASAVIGYLLCMLTSQSKATNTTHTAYYCELVPVGGNSTYDKCHSTMDCKEIKGGIRKLNAHYSDLFYCSSCMTEQDVLSADSLTQLYLRQTDLYNDLSKDYNLGPIEEYLLKMQHEDNRRILYTNLHEDGYYNGSFQDFEAEYGY